MKATFEKLMLLDRRWVFLALAVVGVASYSLKDFQVPILVTNESRQIFAAIDELEEGATIFLSIDYDPNSLAELHPMTYAIMEHAFRRGVRIVITSLSTNGPGMADEAIRAIADSVRIDREYNGVMYPGREVVNGVDYAFLGYKPYPAIVILAMGQDFRIPFPADYYGTPLEELPLMENVRNLSSTECVIVITGTNIADMWLAYGQARQGFPLAFGLTGVSTAQYYPYLNSGQLFGLLGGMLGAAEYEQLADNPGLALDGMRVQLFLHWTIIIFIVIGNVGFFVTRKRRGAGGNV